MIHKIITTSITFQNYKRNAGMLKQILNIPDIDTGSFNFMDFIWRAQLNSLILLVDMIRTIYLILTSLNNLGIPILYTWRTLKITMNKLDSKEGKGQLFEHTKKHVNSFLCIISMY